MQPMPMKTHTDDQLKAALVRALTTLGVSIEARIDSSSPQTISSYPEADFIFAPASMGSLGRAMSALRAWPSRPEPILIAVCRDADSGTLRALEAHDVEHAISVDPLNVASLALLMNGRLRRRASITRGREAIDAAASVVEASTEIGRAHV